MSRITWNKEKEEEYLSKQLDPIELAWAAGFFDGEGSVGTYIDRSCESMRLYVQLSQYGSKEELERFVGAVGIPTRIRGPYQRTNLLRYDIAYSGVGSRLVMEKLEPLLCSRKRADFRTALSRLHVEA